MTKLVNNSIRVKRIHEGVKKETMKVDPLDLGNPLFIFLAYFGP